MISLPRLLVVAALPLASGICTTTLASDEMLPGIEADALRLAIDDFKQHHYSTSGDLTHYKVRLHRDADKVEIDFIPDTEQRGPYPGGSTAHGKEVIYTLSLQPVKILSSQLTQ